MLIALTNLNVRDTYPLLELSLPLTQWFDKVTGKEYTAIDVNNINDLFTLDSICSVMNEYYNGFLFCNGKITLNDKGMYKGE